MTKYSMRNFINIVKEWIGIADEEANFEIKDYSESTEVGKISTKAGYLKVYKIQSGEIFFVGAGKDKETIVGERGFKIISNNLIMAKNSLTLPEYRSMGITSGLLLFVNKSLHYRIMSDTHMSQGGASVWKKLLDSPNFKLCVYYLPTNESFDPSEIGIAKTEDGITVIDPRNDNGGHEEYRDDKPFGQRFFWIIESSADLVNEQSGTTLQYIEERHKVGLLPPYQYLWGDYD